MGEYPSLCVRNMHAVRTQCKHLAKAQTQGTGKSPQIVQEEQSHEGWGFCTVHPRFPVLGVWVGGGCLSPKYTSLQHGSVVVVTQRRPIVIWMVLV